jgi:hypothetical protein
MCGRFRLHRGEEIRMRWQTVLCVVVAVVGASRAQAADGQAPLQEARPFSLHAGLGSHLNDGGDLQSLSFGYSGLRPVTLLVSVERNHVPARVRTYTGGGAATRGGTVTAITGEVRYSPMVNRRLSPYVMAALGGGISRPNVNPTFPDAVSNVATIVHAGGGLRVRLRPRIDLFVDGRVQLITERDVIGGRLPIRGGLTWHF